MLDDLLRYEDGECARRAYRALLGREADAAGLDAQVAGLRNGSISKLQFLEALPSSDEGQDHGTPVPTVTHHRRARIACSAARSRFSRTASRTCKTTLCLGCGRGGGSANGHSVDLAGS